MKTRGRGLGQEHENCRTKNADVEKEGQRNNTRHGEREGKKSYENEFLPCGAFTSLCRHFAQDRKLYIIYSISNYFHHKVMYENKATEKKHKRDS